MEAQVEFEIVDGGQETAGSGGPATYSGLILDGKLVVTTAQGAYEAGRIPKVALIIGQPDSLVSLYPTQANARENFNLNPATAERLNIAIPDNFITKHLQCVTIIQL